jgi:tetratricopeptide (TPR) repeat protein
VGAALTVSAGLASLADHEDPWIAAAARLFLAHAAESSGDAAGALAHFATARDLFGGLGDRWGVVSALGSLGVGHGLAGDHGAAIAALDEAQQLAQALGAEDEAARIRVWRGLQRLRAGDRPGAREEFARAGADGRARHSAEIAAFADVGLAELARHEGDPAEARRLLTGALHRLGRVEGLPEVTRVQALTAMGRTAVAEGDLDDAREHLSAALKLALAVQDGPTSASVSEALADLALARGCPDQAVRFLGLAAAARGAADRGSPDVARAGTAARAARPDGFDAEYAAAAGLCAAEALAALAEMDV